MHLDPGQLLQQVPGPSPLDAIPEEVKGHRHPLDDGVRQLGHVGRVLVRQQGQQRSEAAQSSGEQDEEGQLLAGVHRDLEGKTQKSELMLVT